MRTEQESKEPRGGSGIKGQGGNKGEEGMEPFSLEQTTGTCGLMRIFNTKKVLGS